LALAPRARRPWSKTRKLNLPYLCYDITHEKSKTFQLKKISTRRLPASLEGLNSSLAHLAGELWWGKVTQKNWLIWDFRGKSTGSEDVEDTCCLQKKTLSKLGISFFIFIRSLLSWNLNLTVLIKS